MINDPSLNNRPTKIERALISVFDKKEIVPFAQELSKQGIQILSTGGTAHVLSSAGVAVVDVADDALVVLVVH